MRKERAEELLRQAINAARKTLPLDLKDRGTEAKTFWRAS